ncbi:MAG: M1 family metallopeptidase [Thermoplasmata archaeon]
MIGQADPPQVDEYRLHLDVDFAGQRWTGTIEFDIVPAHERISLDCERLGVRGAWVEGLPATHHRDSATNLLHVVIPRPGPRARVRIEFEGVVDPTNLMGLYRSKFADGYALVSQCEATGARKIFPCFDRPDRKARFLTTIATDEAQDVVSNTPPEKVTTDGSRRLWKFAPTPPMATYLFYVGIGPFERVEDRSGRVAIAVLTARGSRPAAAFALNVTGRLLHAFEEYYGIEYPLPKLDLIGVPEHPFGAMENWGAISFRDMQLLVTERSGTLDRRRTFETIAHELAHQWFGNLVTMYWWTDIWLNESFATWMGFRAVDRLAPEEEAMNEFFTLYMGPGLRSDSLHSTVPVSVPVANPDEINQVFDPAISYGKGASVLRMIEAYLGEDAFRRGVTDYLTRHRWQNARTTDLWEALARASHEPIPEILGPWIERAGLPVVEGRRVSAGIELRQRRYRFDGVHERGVWKIPMVIDVNGRTERIRFDSERRVLPVPAEVPVHLNRGAVGFYRVLYDPALYAHLLPTFAERPMAEKWIVMEDLYAFVLSGEVPFETFTRFARALSSCEDYVVVGSVSSALRAFGMYAPDAVAVSDLARSFLADQFHRIGPRAQLREPIGTGVLRESLSLTRAMLDPGFARELSELFVEWERLDPDLRGAVAIGRSRTEGEVAHHEIRQRLSQNPPEGEAARLENALSWSDDPNLVEATLDSALRGEINRGHAWTVMINAGLNRRSRDVTWTWLQAHAAELNEFFRGTGFMPEILYPLIPVLGLGRAEEVRTFFATNPFPEGARGAAKGLEMLTIAENVARRLGEKSA